MGAVGLGLMVSLMRMDYHWLTQDQPAPDARRDRAARRACWCRASASNGTARSAGSAWVRCRRLQPSEFAKLALIIYVSAWLAKKRDFVSSFALGFIPFVLMVGVVAGLIMLEPDTGTASVLVLVTLTLFFVAGASLRHMAALMGIGFVLFMFLIFTSGYRADRVLAFTSAEDDPAGLGFQTLQLLIALGSGGIEGLGPGREPPEALLYSGLSHRRHLRHHRRGARIHRSDGRPDPVRCPGLSRLPAGAASAGRLRLVPGDGHCLLDRVSDADQRRRHQPRNTDDGHPAAVPQLWRIGADLAARRDRRPARASHATSSTICLQRSR